METGGYQRLGAVIKRAIRRLHLRLLGAKPLTGSRTTGHQVERAPGGRHPPYMGLGVPSPTYNGISKSGFCSQIPS